MLDELKDMMYERLVSYKKHSSTLPDRILVFRDGVSEVCSLPLPAVLISRNIYDQGQFNDVLTQELTQITGAFERLSQGKKKYNPELAIIVCGCVHFILYPKLYSHILYSSKRHHTK